MEWNWAEVNPVEKKLFLKMMEHLKSKKFSHIV